MKKKFEFNLESLRGLAALMVVFGHIFYYKGTLDPDYKAQLIGNYVPPAHFSVLLFFCLSGYVIGISHPKPLKTQSDILLYLKKRFIRLYPIYLISLLIIVPFIYNLGIIKFAKHLIFGQNLLCGVYFQNNPLWSLNYEVIYYLLFIVISYFELSAKKVVYGLALLGVTLFFIHPHFAVSKFSAYLLGFFFWVFGWLLSKYTFKKNEKSIPKNVLFSLLFLILSNSFQVIHLPAHYKNYFNTPNGSILSADLLYIPFCIYFILIFSNASFKYMKAVTAIVFLLPLVTFFPFLFSLQVPDHYKLKLIFYLSSLALLIKLKPIEYLSAKMMNVFIYFGSISYALYVLHFPLMSYFNKIKLFSGSGFTFVTRLTVFCFILFSLSVLLEKYLQPWIRKKFFVSGKRTLSASEN